MADMRVEGGGDTAADDDDLLALMDSAASHQTRVTVLTRLNSLALALDPDNFQSQL